MRLSKTRFRSVLPGVVTLVLLAGCSGEFDYGPRGTISGRLSKGGQPLPAGTYVSFMEPEKGYLAFGTTDEDGRFTIDSAFDGEMPIGTYGVMIQPAMDIDPDSVSPEDQLAGRGPKPINPELIPQKYRQFSTSELRFPIKEGPNTIDIDLE